MSGSALSVAAAPLVAWWVIAALAAAGVLLVGFGLFRGARGVLWRAAALGLLLLTLVNPSLVEEKRDPQKDVALLVADESPSQRIGERRRYTEAALAQLQEKLAHQKDL
jgi:hypothetical protein